MSAVVYKRINKHPFREPLLDLFLILFYFILFSNSIIKLIQNDSNLYRCPSGVEQHNSSGYRYGILNKSEELKDTEEISATNSAKKLLDFHNTG